MRRFQKVTIRNHDTRIHGSRWSRKNTEKDGTYFRVERVPKELMYTDFVYGEGIPNSEVAFDAKSVARFDALEPMDPKLWNQELMRREEWFKHWAQATHQLAGPNHTRRTGRADRLARARFQAYGGRTGY
jgi:hypothetical protein